MESDSQTTASSRVLTVNEAWSLLLAARDIVDSTQKVSPCGLAHGQEVEGQVAVCNITDSACLLRIDNDRVWSDCTSLPSDAQALLDLYLPFLNPGKNDSTVIGHIGQSLDAQIATHTGDAFFVTGPENRKHLHCMRALAHAVVVGVETVVADNPQLTTRDVVGEHPIRVVLDPTARMPEDAGMLRDRSAPTWVIQGCDTEQGDSIEENITRICLPLKNGRMQMRDVLSALAEKGASRIFVEGGGLTVSGMLTENCLDYFQLAAAPVFVGAGRSSVRLPTVMSMNEAFRPPYSLYRMGADVLWNFDLRDIDASESGIASRESFDASMDDLPAIERLF